MTRFVTTTKIPPSDSLQYSIILLASIPPSRSASAMSISMYPVNSKERVLDIQYDTLRAVFPKADIFIVTGYNTLQIVSKKPDGLRVIENLNYPACGEAEELRLGLNATNTKTVITIAGDILFNDTAIEQIKGKHSSILIDKSIECNDTVGSINNKSKLENLSYGLPNKWCGISLFTGKELETLKKLVNNKAKGNLCIFEVINSIIQNNHGIMYTVQHNNGYIKRILK